MKGENFKCILSESKSTLHRDLKRSASRGILNYYDANLKLMKNDLLHIPVKPNVNVKCILNMKESTFCRKCIFQRINKGKSTHLFNKSRSTKKSWKEKTNEWPK